MPEEELIRDLTESATPFRLNERVQKILDDYRNASVGARETRRRLHLLYHAYYTRNARS